MATEATTEAPTARPYIPAINPAVQDQNVVPASYK